VSDGSSHPDREPPLIVGDFYAGAYGPTIILIARTVEACCWLQGVFRELAAGGSTRDLTAESEVRMASPQALQMVRLKDGPRVTLKRPDGDAGGFVWAATADGWRHLADLVQPLCGGGAGHQYLTEDVDDAALIELSFEEPDVLSAASSMLGEDGDR
jgi:hypothetical protein